MSSVAAARVAVGARSVGPRAKVDEDGWIRREPCAAQRACGATKAAINGAAPAEQAALAHAALQVAQQRLLCQPRRSSHLRQGSGPRRPCSGTTLRTPHGMARRMQVRRGYAAGMLLRAQRVPNAPRAHGAAAASAPFPSLPGLLALCGVCPTHHPRSTR